MKRRIVYDTKSGRILNISSMNVDIRTLFSHLSDNEFELNIGTIVSEDFNISINKHKVVNNKVISMSDDEIKEVSRYGRVLTNTERVEMKNTPTPQEIKEAKYVLDIAKMASFFANENGE